MLHQKNKIKLACYREGIRKARLKVKQVRKTHFLKAKNKLIPKNHDQVASKRPRGQTVSADAKQVYLNVYDYFRNQQNLEVNEVNPT